MNAVQLIGRLGQDIELRYTQGGVAVASFSLAVDRYTKGNRDTDWIDVTVFGSQAENANKYLRKGSKCGVQGSIRARVREKTDGTKQKRTEVWANNIEFLDSRPQASEVTANREEKQQSFGGFQPVDESDIPF